MAKQEDLISLKSAEAVHNRLGIDMVFKAYTRELIKRIWCPRLFIIFADLTVWINI